MGGEPGCGFDEYEVHNHIRVRHHICIPEAQDFITSRFQEPSPFGVVHDLFVVTMLRPIQLDNQFRAVAGEIGEVVTKLRLTAEM